MAEVFKKWDIAGYNREDAVTLTRAGFNPLVSVIMASRGMSDPKQTRAFLSTDTEGLYDPFLLPDMDKAVDRINTALSRGEKIAIYGDYDVDGMTSSTLLALYLRSLGADVDVYVPDRFYEGYGINVEAVDRLAAAGVTIIISVDCGITAIEETNYAKTLGVDMIITDHHETQPELPDAVAVIDPKRADSNYPNKHLAGVGVAFKLICAHAGAEKAAELLYEYGDLVALGTVADVVRLLDENRILTYHGINTLNNTKRPGLQALIREANFEGRVLRSNDVGFFIAPRINAAGRMGRSSLSVELMTTEDELEAETLSVELCRLNGERKRLVSEMGDEAIAALPNIAADAPIILHKRGWFQGVTGIVASRLVTRCCLPAVMISVDDEGVGRGSCRSCGGFNLYEALSECGDILLSYGGHEMAAGFSIREELIDEFKLRFSDCYRNAVKVPPVPTLKVDFEVIKPGLLTLENVEAAAELEPFGDGNLRPILCMKDAYLNFISPTGGGQHTRLRVTKNRESFDCIAFGRTVEEIGLRSGDNVDLAFELYVNTYRGHSSVRFIISDICSAGERETN